MIGHAFGEQYLEALKIGLFMQVSEGLFIPGMPAKIRRCPLRLAIRQYR